MRRRNLTVPLALAAVALGDYCPVDGFIETVTSITVSPTAPELDVGETVQLTATVSSSRHNGVVWTTHDRNIVSIGGLGVVSVTNDGTLMVTAVSPGRATIAASPEGDIHTVASATVTVHEVVVEVGPPLSLSVGQIAASTCTLRSEETGKEIAAGPMTWSSSNQQVAKVAADGTVTALSVGTTSITCVVLVGTDLRTGSTTITVTDPGSAPVAMRPNASQIIGERKAGPGRVRPRRSPRPPRRAPARARAGGRS